VYAVAGTAALGLLGFLNLSSEGGRVFNWLLNISGVAGLTTWASTCLSHLYFMRALKAQGISRSSLPYVSRFQPYTAVYGLFFNVLIMLTQGFTVFINWNISDFFAAYISLILFVVLWAGHKLWYRNPAVDPAMADLARGRYDLHEERSAADGGV
jgi:amino acid transporter